ncbi:MAG TPA: DUF6799 domain-containing protein [Chitinophagales bacterium]|nr:DUF6799 domain-containing protein [Chitinophagales bacterium]
MKAKLFLIIGLALSVSAMAQTTKQSTHSTTKKAVALPATAQSDDAVNPVEYFKMDGKQIKAVKGGIATAIPADRWLKNGTVVTPSGTILTHTGKRVYLQNGETIDGNGVITTGRCREFAGIEIYGGGTCMLD